MKRGNTTFAVLDSVTEESLRIRIQGDPSHPSLIYLPGLHGDWTLVSSFRAAVAGKVRFVEFTYPRSLTWSLDDYAAAIEAALLANGIRSGWLLAESFGSQVAWGLLGMQKAEGRRQKEAGAEVSNSSFSVLPSTFSPTGVIFVGGFVKHPWPWGARLLRWQSAHTPRWGMQVFLRLYEAYAAFRHRHAPETRASVREFVERRTPLDSHAMQARLELIATNDPRPIARTTTLPVYYLAGLVDPLVPWPYVRWWLRRNCPSYRGGHTCWTADHNTLATQPRLAAEVVLKWMAGESPSPSPRQTWGAKKKKVAHGAGLVFNSSQ